MKKLFRQALVFVIAVLTLLTINVYTAQAQQPLMRPILETSSLQNRTLYYKNFITDIKIDEDGTYHVSLQIDVQYNTRMRGIFYNIPEEYHMDMTIDNRPVYGNFFFPVVVNRVTGDDYVVKQEDGFQKIRIGDANRWVEGLRSYTIDYTVTTQDKRLKEFDLIYWDLLGADVQVPIENFEFKVEYPKEVSQEPYLYAGAFGSRGNDYIDYEVDGRVISGRNHKIIPSFTGVTLEQIVPIDYFDYPTPPNFGIYGMFAMLGAGLVVFLAFLRFGRDDVLTIVPNTRPLPGYSSAQIGFVFDGVANNRDILSLIIEWASKGYLKIHQGEGRSKAVSLEKIRELEDHYPSYEREFFEDLFATGDYVEIASLRNKFHTKLSRAQTGLGHFFTRAQYRLKNSTSSALKVLFTLITPLIFSLYLILRGYQYFFHLGYSVRYLLIPIAIIFVFSILFVIAFSMTQHLPRQVKLLLIMIFGFIGGVSYIIGGPLLTMIRALDFYTIIATIAFVGMLIAAAYMDKRTAYGNEIYGHVLGLRQFIEMAEKEELEMLVHEDPEYFYEVLPYAYVLGVSDVWSKQFEDIAVAQPDWYVGPSYRRFNTRDFMYELDSTMASTTNTLSSVPVQTSGRGGGGWSSGGGFGGGGSSGGGFGGGSSGGW